MDCFLFSLVKLEGSENKPVNADFFSSPHSLMLINKGDNVEQWFSTGGSFTFLGGYLAMSVDFSTAGLLLQLREREGCGWPLVDRGWGCC